ncbi:MAG: tRNA (N6-isopentenyl adenosine(37)-C2)-methylthiotransferase MiaB [Christensenellales bacterium]
MNDILKKHIVENDLTYYIETYGCQMNAHESEKVAGILESLGYSTAKAKAKADLIVFNTCCIREHAEEKLFGNLGALKDHKAAVAGAVIAVCGCMMQQPEIADKIIKRFPFVDIVFGTNHLQSIASMLCDVLIKNRRALSIELDETIIEGLPAVRNSTHSAFVNIIYGCNNFCTYCVVPFVRGRERSRRSAEILKEINLLCRQGVTEVTLLGQNVNSYGKDLKDDLSFPQLLKRIDEETDIKRLRFMTSHPKDLTEELINCYGRLNSLCEHIHLPVQSGSDRILDRMNRCYTKAHYIGLVKMLRQRVPNIAITTDIIVGFPGETEDDFVDTLDLVASVQYDAAYTFAYSSRALTKAASMPDHLDKQTKSERLARLNALVSDSMVHKNSQYLNKIVKVLIDGCSKRDENEVSGMTRTAKSVSFKGNAKEIGCYVNVKIDAVKAHTLHGMRLKEEQHGI